MLTLTPEQQERLREVTHDLMLLAACSSNPTNEAICSILGALYSGVLEATEQEAADAAEVASVLIKRELREAAQSYVTQGALH